jgi:hypothetical protein
MYQNISYMVNNVFIFISDALRRDYLPESVRERGDEINTIASSTITPTSFSTILSGVEPPNHGVRTFYYQLDQDRNLLCLDEYNTSFWELIDNDPIYEVLSQDPDQRQHLSQIEPPFIHIERELSTHAPYAQWDKEHIEERNQKTAGDFFNQYLGKWDDLQSVYRTGVEESAKRFETRLQTLADRGILNDTLVIFTSDHGELLGEYGEWSHTLPLVPELIHVPTVLIHPEDMTSSANLFRHVDILPTIADVLDFNIPWETDGKSYYSDNPAKTAYAEYLKPSDATATSNTAPIHRRYEYIVRSLWDIDGGWAFNESDLADRLNHIPIAAHRLLWLSNSTNLLHPLSGFRQHLAKVRRFNDPGLSQCEAKRAIERILQNATSQVIESEVSDEQREQLQQLGYI